MSGSDHDNAGVVAKLLLKEVRQRPMKAVVGASVEARRGLMGDCNANRLGPRQLLIVCEEVLEDLELDPGQVRANVVTRGLQESALQSGVVLRLGGEVRVRITHVCEVCKVLRRSVSAEAFRALLGRRGSLAVVLSGGRVSLDDPVGTESRRYPEVPEGIYDRLGWVLQRLPPGRVVTYDVLLQLLGLTRPYFRTLPGYLKRADSAGLPAHRVLTSARQVGDHLKGQRRRLVSEGIELTGSGTLVDPGLCWSGEHLYTSPQ